MSKYLKYISVLLVCMLLGGCYTATPINYRGMGTTRSTQGAGDNPLLTEVSASEEQGQLSRFSTDFKNPKKARAHNITLAAEKINNSVVQPSGEFSFNETVGPTTKRNGFKLGMIFNSGRRSQGYGGGVCQVSSTLYNSARDAGMEITERHEHSLDVGYIERGNDAATSYGVKDLKFKNPHNYPVLIKAYVSNETIITEFHRA